MISSQDLRTRSCSSPVLARRSYAPLDGGPLPRGGARPAAVSKNYLEWRGVLPGCSCHLHPAARWACFMRLYWLKINEKWSEKKVWKEFKPWQSDNAWKSCGACFFKISIYLYICDCQLLVHFLFDWWAVDLSQRAQSKSFTQGSGAPYVTTSGTTVTQRWCVDSWDWGMKVTHQ